MATMNISLPDDLKAMVDLRVLSGHYANASDYVRDLIRYDLEDDESWSLDAETAAAIDKAEAGRISPRSIKQIIAEEFGKYRSA